MIFSVDHQINKYFTHQLCICGPIIYKLLHKRKVYSRLQLRKETTFWSYSCAHQVRIWESEGKAPLILIIGTRLKLVVGFTSLLLYPVEKVRYIQLRKVYFNPRACRDVLLVGKRIIWFIGRLSCRLPTTSIEPFRFNFKKVTYHIDNKIKISIINGIVHVHIDALSRIRNSNELQ
jgi:hypothetical protein